MEVLVLDGKNYVKASKAARELGYASDYVGQLCRTGQVDAHLIGRTWYVNQDKLGTHRVEKKRMSRIKAREYAKRSIEEHRTKSLTKQNSYENVGISYERDDSELLPDVKKLQVTAEKSKNHYIEHPKNEDQQMIIENEGEKVSMSGVLKVTDATYGDVDSDTTILESVDVEQKSESRKSKIASKSEDISGKERRTVKAKTFEEKMALIDERNQLEGEGTATPPLRPADEVLAEEAPQSNRVPIWPLAVSVAILLASIATLPMYKEITFKARNPLDSGVSTSFSVEKITAIIHSKI